MSDKFPRFEIVPGRARRDRDRFVLVPCGKNGWAPDNGKAIASGSFEAVIAAATLLTPDDWRVAKCITPNGRTDSHGAYVESTTDGSTICAFCKERLR